MEDHRLGRLLRELPRESARTGFTARVLARLEEDPSRSRRAWRPGLALAAAALAAIVLTAGLVRLEQSREAARSADLRETLQEIRAEHDRLERELGRLAAPPPVYVGGDERVDLVLDLDNIPAAGVQQAADRFETF